MSISLHVGGLKLDAYEDIRVSASLESVHRDASFGVATAPAFDLASGWIRPGSEVTVQIEDQLVMTGYCITNDYSYDKKSAAFQVDCASKTIDLVESSVVDAPNRWRNQQLQKIIVDLIAPYGIELVIGKGAATYAAQTVKRYKATRGQKVFDALDALVDSRGLLLTDDEQGRLVLMRVSADDPPDRATTAIVYGSNGNILKGRFRGSGAGLYSTYICKGQHTGSDTSFGASVSLVSGSVTDQTLDRYRPLLIRPDRRVTKSRAKDLARWHAANASGRAAQSVYTVGGWTQDDGSLWRPGLMASVDDSRVGVKGELLIVECDYINSKGTGEVTQITLAPAAGYELLGPDERKARKTKAQQRKLPDIDAARMWLAIGDSIVASDPRFAGIGDE